MTVRTVQTFRCPKDGRVVARVLADLEGGRWLEVTPGRDSHTAAARAARFAHPSKYVERAAVLGAGAHELKFARENPEAVARFMRERPQLTAVGPTMGPVDADCPRCHRRLTLGPDPSAKYGVLPLDT